MEFCPNSVQNDQVPTFSTLAISGMLLVLPIHPSAAEKEAPAFRRASSLSDLPACRGMVTGIPVDRLGTLKQEGLFPEWADSMAHFRKGDCFDSSRKWWWRYKIFTSAIERLGSPRETKMLLEVFDKVKPRVDNALSKSRQVIALVNQCVDGLRKNESRGPSGRFDPAHTTAKYLASPNHNGECTSIWDPSAANTPVLQVVQGELARARVLLALSQNWTNPEILGEMDVKLPAIKSAMWDSIPDKQPGLGDHETRMVARMKRDLARECLEGPDPACSGPKDLQIFALTKYLGHMGSNPILYYFNRAADPKDPVTGAELAFAYGKQQAKMNRLMDRSLRDRDYFYFRGVLDSVLEEIEESKRGDYCEAVQALYDGDHDLERANQVATAASALAGGVGALTAKGVFGRLAAALVTGSSITEAQLLSDMVAQFDLINKIEATCAQSHLHAGDLCNVETVLNRQALMIQDGIGMGTTGTVLAAGLGLIGPVKRWISLARKLPPVR